ncbi:MAG: Lrp/AsnC family transcriptional regulator, partial [Gammaproteobacteria bacterium]|nr:Lrp/AsnC family transcriptional regulator [Gammaproteobacteria bacterium]
PICERPFAAVCDELGVDEETVVRRIGMMLEDGRLSRFGPLYNADALGGTYTLVAMSVPDDDVDRVAAIINAFPEVAHNYQRSHTFNIWFVLAVEAEARIDDVLRQIEARTGYRACNLPKRNEYFVRARFDV